jgi:diphosphomevalonate decarboxylase
MTPSTAIAHPNIAFIKYWGNRDQQLRLPSNGSISMNLDGLHTRTRVRFDPALDRDSLVVNDRQLSGPALTRVRLHLERVRRLAGIATSAEVTSSNNFPMGAGIASSASAFAALSLAACAAAGLDLSERDLSRLARLGSGSACRSIPGGFVEWQPGTGDEDSYAFSLAPADHWALADCIAVVSHKHKPTGSSEGHLLADTSPLQAARLLQVPRHLEDCRRAILTKDFELLADTMELDSNLMHAVIMTTSPSVLYWQAPTVSVMQAVRAWRKAGASAAYTIDAGPNVHVICLADAARKVQAMLEEIPGVEQVLVAAVGGPPHLVQESGAPDA